MAYSEWLTMKLGASDNTPTPLRRVLGSGEAKRRWHVNLPSEAEWEKTARGDHKRVFPWGSEWDANRANYAEAQVGGTSAVGCFPGGASPYGVEELSGNIWEWTRSLGRPYPYDPTDGRENPNATGDRVLRGGSFYDDEWILRTACRIDRHSDRGNNDLGFRVVISQGSEK